MNKTTFIIIVLVLILIGGGFVLVQNSQKKVSQNTTTQSTAITRNNSEVPDMRQTANNSTPSRYEEYSKSSLDKAMGNRRVLFFYASWCPLCRPADTEFKAKTDKIPSDVTIVRVNYNDSETDQEEKDLAKQYGVTYQHTFVQIDGQGKEIIKWNGGKLDELLENIK